jgi:hypothetical protein
MTKPRHVYRFWLEVESDTVLRRASLRTKLRAVLRDLIIMKDDQPHLIHGKVKDNPEYRLRAAHERYRQRVAAEAARTPRIEPGSRGGFYPKEKP